MGEAFHFLLTDIEASTSSWEREPGAMRAAVGRHDALLRQVIDDFDGQLFKHVGDGVWATFAAPGAAVEAAVEAQRLLGDTSWEIEEPLRVRMALHSIPRAEIEERDGDLFGAELSRCARLLEVAHGGQVIASDRVRRGVDPDAPIEFRDLGAHRLRDLREPEHIHQVLADGLAHRFPPLRSLDSFPHNLPLHRSSFVGRQQELDELLALVGRERLLTLTGAGGAGKTRLALAAGAELVHRFEDGVWFVDVASVRDPTLVVPHVAGAIGIREQASRPLVDVIEDYLRNRQLLLILDNCEHLVEICAALADRLLGTAPGLRLLVTSRERLGVPGERVEMVTPLPVEAGPDAGPAAAVRLFLDRAAAVVPGFSPGSADVAAIERICRRLDGIPLAVELAAARLTVLSPAELVGRLDDRFRLLTGGHRTALPHHQTLRATLDWSHDLLASREQVLFRRLAVFSSPVTLATIERVVADAELPEGEVLDLVDGLVSKSLVQADRSDGRTRYDMLETVRQYALERLVEAAEADTLRDSHADWLLSVGAEVRAEQTRTTLVQSENIGVPEVRAALDWLRSTRPVAAVELASSVASTWFVVGRLAEARRHLEQALAAAGEQVDPGLEARAHTGLAVLAVSQGDVEVAERYAGPVVETGGRFRSRVVCLWVLGTVAWIHGDADTSLAHHREGLELAQQLEYGNGERLHLTGCARALASNGELEEASAIYEQLLALPADQIRQDERVWALDGRSRIAYRQGELDRAEELAQQALESYEEIGYVEGINSALAVLGVVAVDTGALDLARRHLARGVEMAHRIGHRGALAATLEACAALALAEDDASRSARLLGAVEALREELGAGGGSDTLALERVRTRLRSALGDDLERRAAEGRAMEIDTVVRAAVERG